MANQDTGTEMYIKQERVFLTDMSELVTLYYLVVPLTPYLYLLVGISNNNK